MDYACDPTGRKVSRTAGTVVEYYVYDGPHIVADLDANKNLLRTYAYGPGIDNILTMTRYFGNNATATYQYIKDHLNTVIALANSSGTVVESYEYDAYGNSTVFNGSGTEIQQSAVGNRYTFQGREIDWETGLFYFRARWYDAEIGRWLSKDPIGIRGGLNQYVFCGNNPVNFIDPLGLQQGDGWKNSSALTWYLRDYEQGNKNALAQIGSIYAEGGYGIDRDLEKAESWLKKLVNETYKSGRNSANHYGIGKLKLSYHSVLDKKGLHIDYFPTLAYNESLARKDDLAGTEFAVWLYAAHKSSG